ncbi:MAG: hypothetical protein QM796_18735 [Chthoniobacteraceae bacterium]
MTSFQQFLAAGFEAGLFRRLAPAQHGVMIEFLPHVAQKPPVGGMDEPSRLAWEAAGYLLEHLDALVAFQRADLCVSFDCQVLVGSALLATLFDCGCNLPPSMVIEHAHLLNSER